MLNKWKPRNGVAILFYIQKKPAPGCQKDSAFWSSVERATTNEGRSGAGRREPSQKPTTLPCASLLDCPDRSANFTCPPLLMSL